MAQKVKGLKIAKDLLEKFKFTSEGNSRFGSSIEDSHSLIGGTETSDVALTGQLSLEERIANSLFGVPQLAGDLNTTELQDLKDNASQYEGSIVYLTTASTIIPFVDNQKFYFCESGTWHPSPFVMATTDSDGDGIPDTEDPFITETINGITSIILNTTNLQSDLMFEEDASGDVMIESNPGSTNGNFELDNQGDVMPSAS